MGHDDEKYRFLDRLLRWSLSFHSSREGLSSNSEKVAKPGFRNEKVLLSES
jgi:hypothetical protein